ncbi:MAG TPA: NosD domain-containing protein [Candidatus Limnocylindrales bacterium]|nr:NosD domain-containing protein [Candidatus Limnocylindrales bacterium]
MEQLARRPVVPTGSAPRGRRRWRAIGRVAGVAGVLALVASLAVAGSAAASGVATLYVSPLGSNAASCSWAHPCRTISHTVSVAPAGSIIVVRAGTYHEQVFVTKRLTLRGFGATINANGLLGSINPLRGFGIIGMGVLVAGPGASGSVVEGFRVENAPAEGILVAMTSHVRILNNEVLHNDRGATTTFNPAPAECAEQGNVPGDCGEGVHFLTVASSRAMWNDVHDNVGGFLLTDEVGPTHGNLIEYNVSKDNKLDCGITLPSHNGDAVSDPSKGGVYDNVVAYNLSEGNGGAGVGMFAPFPGAAAYDNVIVGNTLLDNAEAGVSIHSHTPGQNVNGNVIIGNRISGNGIDPDFVNTTTHIGIAIGSVADSVHVVVAANRISHENVGIYRIGPIHVIGLSSNIFSSTVGVHIK